MHLRLIFLCTVLLPTLTLHASNLKGIVVADQEGGPGVARVKVSANGANITETGEDGGFSLQFPNKQPGDMVHVVITQPGYVVVNWIQLKYILAKDPDAELLEVVICKESEREEWARKYFRMKSISAIGEVYDERLRRLEESNRQTISEMREAIDKLSRERDRAKAEAEKAARGFAQLRPGDVTDLYEQAMSFFLRGNIDEALRVLDEQKLYQSVRDARQLNEQAQQAETQAVKGYLLKGQLLTNQFRFTDAENVYMSALAIQKEFGGEQGADYARTLDALASLYVAALSKEHEAEILYKQALKIEENEAGTQNQDYATSLAGLANAYVMMGRNKDAEPLYKQSLTIQKRTVGESHPSYAATLSDLADLYRLEGKYALAEPLYKQSLAIQKQALGDHHPDYARSLDRLGGLYDGMGRYQEAVPLLKQALAIRKAFGEENPEYARSLNNLAILYKDMGQYQESESLYLQALEVRKKIFGSQSRIYAATLDNLAQLYHAEHRYQDADSYYMQALDIRKKTLGDQDPAYATNLANLSLLYRDMKRYREAESLSRQALQIRKEILGEYNPQYASNLKQLADILVISGRQQQACRLLLQSAQLQWQNLTENFPTMSDPQKRQFLSRSRFVQSEELSALSFQGNGANAKDGFEGVLLSKNLLFEVGRDENRALSSAIAGAPPGWMEQWHQREKLCREYAAAVLQLMSSANNPRDPEHAGVKPESVQALSERIERLDEDLRQNNPAYLANARLHQVTFEDVSRALRPGEALAEYVRYRPINFESWKQGLPRYGVFVLTGGSAQVLAIDLGDAGTIDSAVRDFRSAMDSSIEQFETVQPSRSQTRRSEAWVDGFSTVVRELIWRPLEKNLTGIKRVYVAPDGELSLIPFDALARRDVSGRWWYLTEEWQLAYVNSGRDLGRLELTAGDEASPQPKTAVLVGDPEFDARPEELAAMEALQPPGRVPLETISEPAAQSSMSVDLRSSEPEAGDPLDLEIPRHWARVNDFGALIQQIKAQTATLRLVSNRYDWSFRLEGSRRSDKRSPGSSICDTRLCP